MKSQKANKKTWLGVAISFALMLLTTSPQRALAQQWTTNGNNISNTNTGNVGIGTSAPTARLDVNDSIKVAGPLGSIGVRNTDGWTQIVAHRTGSYQAAFIAAPSVPFSITNPYWAMGLSTDGSSGWSLDTWDGTNLLTRMRVLADTGNVGIGTTSPSQKLAVAGNIALSTGGDVIGDTTNVYLRLNNTSGAHLGYANTAFVLTGGTASLTVNSIRRLYVDGTFGKVAVGPNIPVARLNIQESGGSTVGGLTYGQLHFSPQIATNDLVQSITFGGHDSVAVSDGAQAGIYVQSGGSYGTKMFFGTANPILSAASVTYQYRTKSSPSELKDITQMSSITTASISTESYGYDSEGRVSSKTLTLTSRPSHPFVTDYIFDPLDRITDVRYPAEYGNGTQPRKVVHHDYDVASRLTGLTVDGAAHASQIVYDASSQTTLLKVGLSGANQITESYAYNSQTGLLDNQTVVRGGATTLLNLSYDYAGANGKRTGQLTKITNNLHPSGNRNRSYSYDALGRLVQAKGGPFAAPLWSQTYTYDRYGNRTSVVASGNTARLEKPAEPKPQSPGSLLAFNSSGTLDRPPHFGPDQSVISDSPSGIRLGLTPESSASAPPALQGGPPVFTDDPLTAGVAIKAAHVTELRDAVNQARSLAGLGAASWAEAVAPGVTIKAAHILELRTRLNEARAALGLSAASYTDSNLTAGITVKAAHLQELRDRVREALAGDGSCPPGQNLNTDQFVKNFYQGALARQPNSAELQSWASQLRQAYYQGQSQQLATAQYMGRQLFRSQEYANRNRDDHLYVYDLYKAYLQREPDQAGWDFWTANVAQNGRDQTRLAFDLSQEFANKVASLCPGSAGSAPVPLDGLANLSYDSAINRITTSGFSYDAAGNQTRIVRADGSGQKFQYDAANRLVKVTDDYAYTIATYTYGDSNERLIVEEGSLRTYCAWVGDTVVAEYMESGSSTTPLWSKSYIYLSARLLSTLSPNGSGGEAVQYQHPDRLGTRLVTNGQDTTSFEQVTLPFGTVLDSESTGSTKRRFTSYDRSAMTGLDYAVNRHYDAQQGRFTQVDPMGMASASLDEPQSLNLYGYLANDPINRTDPSGLFFGFLKKLFSVVVKILKWVAVIVAVALIIVATINIGNPFVAFSLIMKAYIAAAGILVATFAPPKVRLIVGLAFLAYGIYTQGPEIIHNFTSGAPEDRVEKLFGWIGAVGAVAGFLGQGRGGRNVVTEVDPTKDPLKDTKKETRQPPKNPNDEVHRIPKGKPDIRLPRNPTAAQRFKFTLGQLLKLFGNPIIVMIDPAVIAEIACEENPGSQICRDFVIFLPPKKRCKFRLCA